MLKNRIGYGSLWIVSLVLFLFFHSYFFFVWMISLCILPGLSYLVGKYIIKHMNVSVSMPIIFVEEEQEIPVQFKLTNSALFPMPSVDLFYKVENQFYPNEERHQMTLPLHRGQKQYDWSVKSIYSGRICLVIDEISVQDYLGLFVWVKKVSMETVSNVFPKLSKVVMNSLETSFTEGDEQEMDTVNSVEDVTQVREVREYRPGDRMQRVHWKLSTKQDALYVKEYEREYNRTITLLVELKRDSQTMGELNTLIQAFYSTARRLIEDEMVFQVQWFDVEHENFHTERVEEEDALLEVLQQMYMMQSYQNFLAFEMYSQREHKPMDVAIYFTTPSFHAYDPEKVIGTFDDKVMMLCLDGV